MVLKAGTTITGADLSSEDFTDKDLTDLSLVDCTLEDAQFSNIVLEGARFKGCRILRCGFAHADLRDTQFEDCVFSADQKGCRFAFSRLDEARFARCDLSFVTLDRSSLYASAFETCNLRGAVFLKADFGRSFGKSVVRWAGKFAGCNLELADLAEVRAAGVEFTRSSFREADLRDADLEGCDLRETDLFQALTTGAKLANADLRGAEVSGLDLSKLGSFDGLKVTADQQYRLLTAMGLDVHAD